jgi:hypothetical protein
MTEPTAATSTDFAPDRPETTCRSPPLRWPTSACTKRTRRKLIPPWFMITAASTKNGRASKTKLLIPFTIVCGSATNGMVPETQR